MPEINTVATRNETYTTDPGSRDERRYWPYPAGAALDCLKQAIWIVENNIYRKNNACNNYFKTLPGGRTFDDVWRDPKVLINYDPEWGINDGYVAYTGMRWRISLTAVLYDNLNRWAVAGTLVHELAHVNGAPGKASGSAAADKAKIFWGLQDLYSGVTG